ncbi:hypothetical protein TRICI_004816 [Trichomonascus ciferrii]|uniref:PWWP domain-containing protein n=1 Tax=Trichomonascus ciferrii TaxID=44093 RepID=A0A642UYR3_9ASCO|nr:hypothetical protein TRICI_004816 [Trichomonascus ciferrii]
MTEELTPSGVMKAKPKGAKGKAVWPVRFFVDGSYMWGGEKELKALSKDDAQAYVDKPKNKRDKTLLEAYRVATNPPSMEDLADNADRPQTSKRKASKRQEEDEAPTNGKKTTTNKRRKAEVKEDKKTTTTKKKEDGGKKKEQEAGGGSEEDAELQPEEVEDESPENIKPSYAKLREDVAGREEQIRAIRHRLQRGFLDSAKPSESQLPQLSAHIKTLEVNPDLEISIIRKFKVNKVLKQLLKIDDIPADGFHRFRERAEKLLIRWSTVKETGESSLGSADTTREVGDETNGDSSPAVEAKKEDENANCENKKEGNEGSEHKKEDDSSDKKKEDSGSDDKKVESEDKKDDVSTEKKDEPKQEDNNNKETNNNHTPAAEEKPAEN